MSDGPLTVTQFNERVKTLISMSDTVRDIDVTGEISEFKQAASGHFYLSLKEGKSVVKCTLFRYAASRVTIKLQVGMKIIAHGNASYYADGGQLNFNIEYVMEVGKGEQLKALEELKAKLEAEGLFEERRKRSIKPYPKTIGVVTSPKGAVIKDIIDTTARRYPVDIILSPATVQGEDAPKSLVNAISLLQEEDIDVMIVGRGGGSAEDLSAFNDESVVRAIAFSKVPVIAAIGHATNMSLSDLVADKYAETPTAAAMIATPDRHNELRNISSIWRRMDAALSAVTDRMRNRFKVLDSSLSPKNAKAIVDVYKGKFNNCSDKMDSAIEKKLMKSKNIFIGYYKRLDPSRLSEKLNNYNITLDKYSSNMDNSIGNAIESRKSKLEKLSGKMEGLDPNNVLSRGYSLIRDGNGRVVTSAKDLFPGTDVTIAMRDGSALAKIKELKLDE